MNSSSCSSSQHSVWELLQVLGLNPDWTEHHENHLLNIYYDIQDSEGTTFFMILFLFMKRSQGQRSQTQRV